MRDHFDPAGARPPIPMNASSTTSQRAMVVFIRFVWGTTWLAM
jgi:hypothetical protein